MRSPDYEPSKVVYLAITESTLDSVLAVLASTQNLLEKALPNHKKRIGDIELVLQRLTHEMYDGQRFTSAALATEWLNASVKSAEIGGAVITALADEIYRLSR